MFGYTKLACLRIFGEDIVRCPFFFEDLCLWREENRKWGFLILDNLSYIWLFNVDVCQTCDRIWILD